MLEDLGDKSSDSCDVRKYDNEFEDYFIFKITVR